MNTVAICDCGHEPTKTEGVSVGYGQDSEGKTFCYACCGERDKASMLETGKATLYLTNPHNMRVGQTNRDYLNSPLDKREPAKVENWPGSLEFPVGLIKCGFHNIAGKRYDFWFVGPDGKTWHGVQYGENSQIAHCRRTKS